MSHFLEQLVTLGFLGAMMWGMLKFLLRDIHTDLSNIKKEISEIKIDMRDMKTDIKKTDARIDHLYEENNRLYRVFQSEMTKMYATLIDLVQKK